MLPYEPFAIADSASVRLPDVAKRSPLQVLIAYAVTVALVRGQPYRGSFLTIA